MAKARDAQAIFSVAVITIVAIAAILTVMLYATDIVADLVKIVPGTTVSAGKASDTALGSASEKAAFNRLRSSCTGLVVDEPFDGTTFASTAEGITYEDAVFGEGALIDEEDVVDYDSMNLSLQEGTIEYWIKPVWNPNTDPEDRKVIMAGDLENGMFITKGDSRIKSGNTYFEIFVNGKDYLIDAIIGENWADWKEGEWHHVAWVWNGTEGEMRVYLDGVFYGSRQYAPFLVNFDSGSVKFGRGWPARINSVIDEFRVYNIARTGDEIGMDYSLSEQTKNLC